MAGHSKAQGVNQARSGGQGMARLMGNEGRQLRRNKQSEEREEGWQEGERLE